MFRSKRLLPRLARLRVHPRPARQGYIKYSRTRRYLFAIGRAAAACKGVPQNSALAACLEQCWGRFVERYERLTDLLCAAARNGCEARYETEYEALRCWFNRHYNEIAPFIRPYLDIEFAPDKAMANKMSFVDYSGQARDCDMLERVFAPSSLGELLHHDSGNLIPQIARVSDAVYRCHEARKSSQA